MNTGYIYARYSTDRQNDNSIETQVSACRAYAARNGIVVPEYGVFYDEARSGMKSNREGFDRLMEAVKSGRCNSLIIYDQSRLAREIVLWFTLRNTLPIYGVTIHSVQRGEFGDLQDPNVFLVEGVEAVFNELHVLTSRKKTIDGLRNIASKGLFAGGSACLGYDIADKHYVVNEQEAQVVRLIFAMYADGKGYGEIIGVLNNKGYRTKAGRTFGKNSLYSILTNERYIGTFLHGAKKVNPDGSRNSHQMNPNVIRLEGAIPAIIDKDVWNIAQKRVKDHKRRAANKATVDYLLSGKIFCGECGGAMCGEKRNNGQFLYYICNTRKRLKTCTKKAVRKEAVEELVLKSARRFFCNKLNIDETAQRLYESMHATNEAIPQIDKAIKAELREVEKKITNINNAIADGVYSSSTVGTLKALEDRQTQLYVQLADLERTKVNTGDTLEEIRDTLANIGNSLADDKLLIALAIDKVICHENGKIRIILNPLDLDGTDILGPNGDIGLTQEPA